LFEGKSGDACLVMGGGRDRVDCASGCDLALVDVVDFVSRNCEIVRG
jgi:hypothetical protein